MPTRAVVPQADGAFLFALYASTRQDELASWGWTAEQIEAFLRMQHACQQRAYELHYPKSEHDIVLGDDGLTPMGSLRVHRAPGEHCLIDIALLPRFRNRGMGTTLLKALQRDADEAGAHLRLSVRPDNPARRLYQRLDFVETDSDAVRVMMLWTPHHTGPS